MVPLRPQCVDVYRCPLPQALDDATQPFPTTDEAVLDESERAHAATLRRPLDALRYRRAHAALREIVGAYLQTPPERLRWRLGPHGKPALEATSDRVLEFNLSHAGGWALVAVADRPVGVDVEALRPLAQLEGMIRRWCAPDEQRRLGALPQERRDAAFLACWTAKEALLKAIGCGLQLPPQRIETPLPDQPGWHAFKLPPEFGCERWRIAWASPDDAHVGAVVCGSAVRRVRQATWPIA
jgi:phosphopantetheine--protein transferase-like protein